MVWPPQGSGGHGGEVNLPRRFYYQLNVVRFPCRPCASGGGHPLVAHFVEKVVADNNMPPRPSAPRPSITDRLRMAGQHPPVGKRGGELSGAGAGLGHRGGQPARGNPRRGIPVQERRGSAARAAGSGRHLEKNRGRADPPGLVRADLCRSRRRVSGHFQAFSSTN